VHGFPIVSLSIRRTVFQIFDLQCTVTLKPGIGITQGHRNWYISICHVWLVLLTFRGNYGPPTVSEINGDFIPKSQTALCILHPPMKGSSWNWKLALGGSKTRIMGLPGRERCLMISSAIRIQYSTRTWRTDGRTPADSKDRANPWRRAVKATFAHTPLYPVTASFQSEYGWTNSAELEFGIIPNQTRQLVSTYSLAKNSLKRQGGTCPHAH